MSGFGGFDQFSQFSDDGDATEDPFGIAARARSTEWWNSQPYGANRKKKSGGGSYFQDALAGPEPGAAASLGRQMTPSPSTTQRVILDQKQQDETAARLFGGGAPRDTGAGDDAASYLNRFTDSAQDTLDGSTNLNGGGVLKYQAPDPTNPGQQDQARAATVDNAALDEYRAEIKAAKELEDQALALPKRTGFWGKYDEQRDRLYQAAQVHRARAQSAAQSVPGASQLPPRWRPGPGTADWIYDENAPAPKFAQGPAGLTPRTGAAAPAPHLETLVSRTGKTVRVDQAAVPRNAQGQLVERSFERDPKLQGPTQPGVDSLGETKETPYEVPDPAAVQAAEFRRDNPAPEKAPKEPTVNPLSLVKEKQAVRSEYADKIEKVQHPERGSYWSGKSAGEAQAEVKRLQQEMQDRLGEYDISPSSPKGGPQKSGGGGIPEKALAAIKAAGGKPVPFKNGKTYVWKNGAAQEVK